METNQMELRISWRYIVEWMSEKIWTFIAALVSAFGGYMVYEKKKSDKRFSKLEEQTLANKIEIAVMQSQYKDLKEDTQEIKELLRGMSK